MKKSLKTILGLSVLAAAAVATYAAVIFDPATGLGFVGKGDVQLAFGWNNAQLQSKASGVSFTYNAFDTYDVECYWETITGSGKIVVHDITIPRHTGVNASVAYDARTRNQITGFNLTGLGATTTEGTVPVVGGTCPGASENATIIAVTQTSSTGGLYVNYGANSVYLPVTPVVIVP
jgi:hypothetical protein